MRTTKRLVDGQKDKYQRFIEPLLEDNSAYRDFELLLINRMNKGSDYFEDNFYFRGAYIRVETTRDNSLDITEWICLSDLKPTATEFQKLDSFIDLIHKKGAQNGRT